MHLISLLSLLALGQVPSGARPDESSMFGGNDSPAPTAFDAGSADAGDARPPNDVTGQAGSDGGVSRDEAMLESKLPYETTDLPPDNPLTIGGLLYLRSQFSATENTPPSQWALSAPLLLDTYLDARPNDRVRGFVLVRTEFDPTYNPATQPFQVGVTEPTSNPDFLLDQLWIKFDIDHKVFVTAGRQHVKWGVAHFWFPNDLLKPSILSPLAVFDQRTGLTMLKADIPLSDYGVNFYAVGLFEGLQQANELGRLGGAARIEWVPKTNIDFLNTFEVGLDILATEGQHNRYGGDLSFGIGDFDLYGEWAMTNLRDNRLWQENGPVTTALEFNPYEYYLPDQDTYQPQIAAGLNYGYRYGNNRVLTFGGEYFYNGLGYSTPTIYPWLLANNDITFFYLGQHYAGLYVLADKPGSWYNSTVNFSTLANLSDHTFISRIDFFQVFLTHLRFETFVDVRYGGNGEFHYSFSTPATTIPEASGPVTIPAINVGAPIFDFGVALRVSM